MNRSSINHLCIASACFIMFASQLTSQYEKPLIYFLIKKIEVQEIMTQIKHDL